MVWQAAKEREGGAGIMGVNISVYKRVSMDEKIKDLDELEEVGAWGGKVF